MSREPLNLVGRTLSRYRLLEEIGKGGMGTVYRAETLEAYGELRPGDEVAVKVVHPHLLATPEALDRFRREASLGLRIRHPHVVRTFDLGEAEHPAFPLHFLVTEYVRGQTLHDLVRELGLVGEEMVVHIARQAAAALAAVHAEGILHRDVKPENLLITEDSVVRLMDLGVARPLWATTKLSRTGQFVGSVLYAAPEQFRRPDRMDARVDLYALGLVLYGLLTGEHPFDHTDIGVVIEHHLRRRPPPPSVRNPELSPFLDAVVMTLLEKDPDARFPDARALMQVLEEREESGWWQGEKDRLRARSRARPAGLAVDRVTPLVGRDPQLARLLAAAERVAGGATAAVLLRGEPGLGKSRLADRFLRDVAEGDAPLRTCVGSASARGLEGPGGGLREALLGALPGDDLEDELDAVLPPGSPHRETCAAFLGGRPVGDEDGAIPPAALPAVLHELLGGLTDRSPLLVCMEDVHAADDATLEQVTMLARAARGRPLLLVLTARPAPAGGSTEEALRRIGEEMRLEVLDLAPLDRVEVEAIVRHALGDEIAARLGPPVAGASAGNPRHVLEILAELRESGRVRREKDGTWTVIGSLERIAMPTSLREGIRGRLAGLSEEERALLEVLAVVGGEADADLLAQVLGREVLAVLRDLGRLERHPGLVRSARGAFLLGHDSLREVVLEDSPPELIRRLHERVAEVLERTDPDPSASSPERQLLLARHLVAAEGWERALAVLPRALTHLEARRAFGEVLDLSSRALDAVAQGVPCPDDVPARIGLGRAGALRQAGRSDEERRELERLARSAEGPLRARVSLELAWSFSRSGELDRALAAASAALQDAQTWAVPEVERESLRCLGGIAFEGGALTQSANYLESALAQCEQAHDLRGEAAILRTLGLVRAGFGDLPGACELLDRATALARRLHDRAAEAACLGNRSLVERDRGDGAHARADQLAALDIFREIADRAGEARALSNLALVEEDDGLLDDALLHHRQAARRLDSLGDRRGLAVTRTNLGLLLESLGRYDEAAGELREALQLARGLQDDALGAAALGALGIVVQAQGDLGAAREALGGALALREDQLAWREASFLQLELARFLALAGRPGEARVQIEAARRQAEASEDADLRLATAEAEIDVAFRAGDHEEVVRLADDLPQEIGPPTRERVRRTVRTGLARLGLGLQGAQAFLERTLTVASGLGDPGPALLARLGLALAGREEPGVLEPLRAEPARLAFEDRCLGYWLGHILEAEGGRPDEARKMLEAAYFSIHRAAASLPAELRETFVTEAFPMPEILAEWERLESAVEA